MRTNLIFIFLMIVNSAYSQTIKFSKTNETASKNGVSAECVYRIEIYNNTNVPICIPVSLSFGLSADINDTLEVINIYPANDSVLTFSLYYSKSDIKGSSTRYPAAPIVINPSTYFLTNIKFIKTQLHQKAFLELNCSYDKGLEYNKIYASFNKNPKYIWMDKLNFINKKYSIY